MPSDGCVGGTPTPRKDSVASMMIAEATWIVASTSTGPITLGSTCRTMMRDGATPITRAACTYSLLRSTIVEPRTVRAYCTQPDSEIAMISTANASVSCAFGKSARPTPSISSAIRIDGNDSITSQIRMINASTLPPAKPDSSPSPTPTTTDTITDASPTNNEMRGPEHQRREDVAALIVGAQRVFGPPLVIPGGRQACVRELQRRQVEGVVRRHHIREQRAEHADEGDHRRADRHRRIAEAVPDVAVEESLQGLGHGRRAR